MGQVAAGVAEADAGHRGGEQHLAAGVVVVRVVDGADDVLRHHLDGPGGPDVADRVRALVSGSQSGVGRGLPAAEGHGGVGLEAVAEDVEAGAGDDHAGERRRVVGVDDAHVRPEGAVGDAGLGLHVEQVEDGDAGGLAAGAGRGRDGDEWLERAGYGLSPADGGVDVVEEVGGVRGVEVGGLCGVDAGAASDGDVAVEAAVGGEGGGVLEGDVGGLDADAVEQHGVDVFGCEGVEDCADGLSACEAGVGEDHDSAGAEASHLVADLAGDAGAELDAGRVE